MAEHVCPWWVGYLLVCPIRRWFQNPEKILSPYISEGMTVLDIGPGMGFFTIPAAQMVRESGRVIAVDLQEKMLKSLVKRAEKAGVAGRIVAKLCEPDSLGVSDPIDLCLAINVVHEVPDASALFSQIKAILKPTGRLLLAEPGKWHVSEKDFEGTLAKASAAGLKLVGRPKIRRSQSALLGLSESFFYSFRGLASPVVV
jgi:ubiquinone/menaquinone biosynthesis C-methylase UbiE